MRLNRATKNGSLREIARSAAASALGLVLLAGSPSAAATSAVAVPRSSSQLDQALSTHNSSSLWIPIGPVTGSFSASALQYARETAQSPRLDLDVRWKPQDALSEVRLIGFAEGGRGSDWNLDLDPVVYRRALSEGAESHVWIGRTHPMNETDVAPGNFAVFPSRVTALGANWVQNGAYALDPRVSGWLSIGAHHRFADTGFHVTAAYSPVFLPNFGPSTRLSRDAPASGSRFARLPPSYARLGEAIVPLRYEVQVGDLMDIVLQNQYFVGAEQKLAGFQYALMAWSAPSPAPSVSTVPTLRTLEDDLDVLIAAKPEFRRENFVGARFGFFEAPAKPELEAVWETGSGRLTVSTGLAFDLGRHILSVGGLHTFNRPAPTAGQPISPNYSDHLAWAELQSYFSSRFSGHLRFEQHLTPGRQGRWVRPEIEYLPGRRLRFYASLSVLTGEDYSYFGTWRSLDAVTVGARIIW